MKWIKKDELDEIRKIFVDGLDANQLHAKYSERFNQVKQKIGQYELISDTTPCTLETILANQKFSDGTEDAREAMGLDAVPYALWFRMYFTDYMITLLSEIPVYGEELLPKTTIITGGELVGTRDLKEEAYYEMVLKARPADKPLKELQIDQHFRHGGEWTFKARRMKYEDILEYWRRFGDETNSEFVEKEEKYFEEQYVQSLAPSKKKKMQDVPQPAAKLSLPLYSVYERPPIQQTLQRLLLKHSDMP